MSQCTSSTWRTSSFKIEVTSLKWQIFPALKLKQLNWFGANRHVSPVDLVPMMKSRLVFFGGQNLESRSIITKLVSAQHAPEGVVSELQPAIYTVWIFRKRQIQNSYCHVCNRWKTSVLKLLNLVIYNRNHTPHVKNFFPKVHRMFDRAMVIDLLDWCFIKNFAVLSLTPSIAPR